MLSLFRIQTTNHARAIEWHSTGLRDWSLLEWAGAMCGEAGEAANVAKKLLRVELNLGGNIASERIETDVEKLRDLLAKEIADTILYALLLASFAGIDAEVAVCETFNKKSEALGFHQRLG